MDKRIFKKCPTLGEYHGMSQPNNCNTLKDWVKSIEEHKEFYNQHKDIIDVECIIYGEIFNDRKKLGGDDKIHKI